MSEEFNLSDEEYTVDGILACALHGLRLEKLEKCKDIINEKYYPKEKVREFIKLLKEELTTGNKYMNELLKKRLDKRAGDKLTK